jgi:hypothetical protein
MRKMSRQMAVLSLLVLSSCGSAPSCDDSEALKILATQSYDQLDTIVTLSVNNEAGHVSCQATYHPPSWSAFGPGTVKYEVFRTTKGNVAVRLLF